MLSTKDYSNEELSEVEFLDFLYCIILSKKEYFLNVLYKSIEIIKKIENINPVFKEELFSTICILVKYHFRNNENKKWELITMIAEIWREIPEDCNSIERNIIYNDKLEQTVDDLKIIIEDKDNIIENQDAQLKDKDAQLKDKDAKIKKLEEYINSITENNQN